MTLFARGVVLLLCVALLYIVTGELLQGWASLHFQAWSQRPAFGNERDRAEWERMGNAIGLLERGWSWKATTHRDRARWHLYGAMGGFRSEADAGEGVLEAVDRALLRAQPTGYLLTLEARGCVMVGDYAGAADAVARLKQVAPYAQPYWQSLVHQFVARAVTDSDLRPIAKDVSAWYEPWRQEPHRRARDPSAARASDAESAGPGETAVPVP